MINMSKSEIKPWKIRIKFNKKLKMPLLKNQADKS